MLTKTKSILCMVATTFIATSVLAQDITNVAGALSSDFTDRNAIQLPAPNVTNNDRIGLQLSGFEIFHRFFTRQTGLGPKFNHLSCGGCHANNGRGADRFARRTDDGSSLVVKVAIAGLRADGSPRNLPGVGEQLQDHVVRGIPQQKAKVQWSILRKRYPDGSRYSLRKPRVTISINGVVQQRKVLQSLRMTPAVIGPGLLEAIPEETILSFSDPEDSNGDGISGKPQYVIDQRTGVKALGRFGFKASHTTVEQQSTAAFFNDIGITSSLLGARGKTPEVSDEDLFKLVAYLKLAGVPKARMQNDATIARGFTLFKQIGCESCHKIGIMTGASSDPELANQLIHPFTDLLLHDMGADLADKRAEFSARGSEWRTTPLWGLGYSQHISQVKARFLHDGRARTIEEAILWHGGEASASRTVFRFLEKADRAAVLAFLNSL